MIRISVLTILLLFISFIQYQCQEPKFTCIGNKPFKNKDLECSDFSEICVKKGDPECDGFQGICEQCPPSNVTLNALHTIFTLSRLSKGQIDVLEKKVDDSVHQQKNREKHLIDKITKLQSTNILILVLLLVIVLILIFEIRFKLFTKCMEKVTNKRRKELYRNFRNRIFKDINNSNNQMNECENLVLNSKDSRHQQDLDVLLIKINDMLERKSAENEYDVDKSNKGHSGSVIKFHVLNTETQIELFVGSDDNVVQIKRQICAKCIDAKLNYKKMQLKYKEAILDDNQYLLSNMESVNDIIQCEINDAINPSDIIVLKVIGNRLIPRLIQVNGNQTIADLKKLISSFRISADIKIFKNKIELNDDQNVKVFNFVDEDSIQIIEIETGHLIMHSIVGDAYPILIEYSNVDLVSSVKKRLTDKLTCSWDEIVLYYDDEYLDKDRFIYELKISRGSDIEYLRLLKLDRLIISGVSDGIGRSCKIFKAKDKSSNKEIFIKMYQFKAKTNLKENKAIVNELRKCKITKSHPRFVQLEELYFDEKTLCVALEYLEGQSMKEYMTKMSSPSHVKQIAKWSKQILEGLQVLHKHKVVFRDLISSNIMRDGKNDIKMSVFGLSKYLHNAKDFQLEGLIQQPASSTRFPIPELMNKTPFGMYTDVWSFGSILSKIMTGHNPYQSIPIADWQIEGFREFDIQFNADVTPEFQNFITCCLKINPKDRPTVDELLRHEYLTMHEL